MNRHVRLAIGIAALALGCVEYDGRNPFDPAVSGGQDPFGLRAIADTTSVRLSWNRLDLSSVEKYVLYRATGDSLNLLPLVEVADIQRTSYTDQGLSAGSRYYYRMRLVADGEESNPSAVVGATPLAGRAPRLSLTIAGQPADTLDYDTGQSALTLTITDSGDADLVVDSIVVSHGWIALSFTRDTIAPGASAALVVGVVRDSLAPRTEPYTATLTITTNAGSPTVAITVTVPDRTPPHPSILQLGGVSPTSATLWWTRCTDADFAGYRLVRSVDSLVNKGDPTAHAGVVLSDTVFIDSGLVSLQSYWYRVYTIDSDSLIDSSNAVKVTTVAARELTGRVTDARLGGDLGGVTVRIAGDDISCVSGTDGTYRILNPDSGLARVEFWKGSYLGRGDTVRIPATGTVRLDGALVPWPAVHGIGSGTTLTDLNDVCADDQYVYTVDRNFPTPREVTLSISSGSVVAENDLSAEVTDPPADVCLLGGRLYITCPSQAKILRIDEPLWTGSTIGRGGCPAPYGIAALESATLLVAAVGDSGRGLVLVMDTVPAVTRSFDVPGFMPSFAPSATLGPRICVAGAYAYVTNGSPTVGKVARVALSGGASQVINTDLPYVSDIAALDGRVYVSCKDGAADSVLVFDTQLNRVRGIFTGCPGSSLAACASGLYAGYVAMTGSGATYGTVVHFLCPLLPVTSGAVAPSFQVAGCCFTPDGNRLVVSGFTHMAVFTP
jgi:hypothetical protein